MKYRVRIDLPFASETDARSLVLYAKNLSSKAVSINEGQPNEEIAFVDLHLCGHEENKPCEKIERVEVRKLRGVI